VLHYLQLKPNGGTTISTAVVENLCLEATTVHYSLLSTKLYFLSATLKNTNARRRRSQRGAAFVLMFERSE
jgi:hypothetical protein